VPELRLDAGAHIGRKVAADPALQERVVVVLVLELRGVLQEAGGAHLLDGSAGFVVGSRWGIGQE
jgi:hypothetical protein